VSQGFPDTATFLTDAERTSVIRQLQSDGQFSAAGEKYEIHLEESVSLKDVDWNDNLYGRRHGERTLNSCGELCLPGAPFPAALCILPFLAIHYQPGLSLVSSHIHAQFN
ncbi:hypothetical protein B0H16DRAFT_1307047, partial [Mycena metata]